MLEGGWNLCDSFRKGWQYDVDLLRSGAFVHCTRTVGKESDDPISRRL